jgi:hypothetical protein
MSMDAGGLAHLTYQSNPFDNNPHLGAPGSGFASRGKASHIKRLSVAPPPKISTIDETQQIDVGSTPRTSRGHLLAGLRTAPKSATIPGPHAHQRLESSKYAAHDQAPRVPQTANAAFFPNQPHRMSLNSGRQMYHLPEQVLAPPTIEIEGDCGQMDQNYYNELVATNTYLAQRQRALQQQLLDVQAAAAAQQLSGLDLNGTQHYQSTPSMTYFNQQLQQGMQPVIQSVPGTPGLYQIFNPMTGQTNFVVDNSGQESMPVQNQPVPTQSPPPSQIPGSRRQDSPPSARSRSPFRTTPTPPQNVEPLPPPSTNAFRRGHKKNVSSFSTIRTDGILGNSGPKSATIPPTPMTGSFAPGQGQAGVKPIRQPRNPTNVNELMEAPTSKHAGSKNFVTRQRRRAVQDLVKAGRERQVDPRQSGSEGGTPASEAEYNFSVSSSDNDDLLAAKFGSPSAGSVSKKTSFGSLHAGAVGVIGSERKDKSRERGSVDSTSTYSVKSLSSDEGASLGGSMAELEPSRRKAPMMVLSRAEKRKSVTGTMN